MNSFQRLNLDHMQKLHDFIKAHPGCTLREMCDHFDRPLGTTTTHLHMLRDGDYLLSTPGLRHHQGQKPTTYRVSAKDRPTEAPPSKRRAVQPSRKLDARLDREFSAKRVVVKAVQVGMRPYLDLPREFFTSAQT